MSIFLITAWCASGPWHRRWRIPVEAESASHGRKAATGISGALSPFSSKGWKKLLPFLPKDWHWLHLIRWLFSETRSVQRREARLKRRGKFCGVLSGDQLFRSGNVLRFQKVFSHTDFFFSSFMPSMITN